MLKVTTFATTDKARFDLKPKNRTRNSRVAASAWRPHADKMLKSSYLYNNYRLAISLQRSSFPSKNPLRRCYSDRLPRYARSCGGKREQCQCRPTFNNNNNNNNNPRLLVADTSSNRSAENDRHEIAGHEIAGLKIPDMKY